VRPSSLTVVDAKELGFLLSIQKSSIVLVGRETSVSVARFTDCRIHWCTCGIDEDPKRGIGIGKIAYDSYD